MGGIAIYASTNTFTVNSSKQVFTSAITTTGKTAEQYYLTINKDSGVSTATSSQWVNKGDSVNVTATAKSGYIITGGTGGTGAVNAVKTINVTSAINGYTLTWSSPLSQYGSYLGPVTSGSPPTKGWKSIVYTNTSGQTAYANPYQSGSITIKPGTAVTLRMVSGSYIGYVGWIVRRSSVDYRNDNNYKLISSSCTPTTSGALSISDDDSYSNSRSYYWYVEFS